MFWAICIPRALPKNRLSGHYHFEDLAPVELDAIITQATTLKEWSIGREVIWDVLR